MSATPDAVPSGIPGLDPLLGGGLPSRGLMFVVGPPGSGKTVFVQQMLFGRAQRGQAALYFSGISEPHDRLVDHLRGFAFFDESMLAHRVQLLSLASSLGAGVDAAVDEVIRTARRSSAPLIVVDGFRGLRGLLESEQQSAALLYRLGTQIGMLGALLIVVLEGDPESEALYSELPLGDVIVALEHDSSNASGRRNLRVLKRRGARPLPGLHAFLIDEWGITCYPQLEAVIQPLRVPFTPSERAAIGLPELDAMLGGGLTVQSMTMVAGSAGTGKTMLGLQFLAAGVARGEPGLFLGFHESYEQLLAKAASFGFDLAAAEALGLVRLLVQPPIALDADILAQLLQDALREGGTRRLVVDSVAELQAPVPPQRARTFAAAVVTLLRGYRVTALLTKEIPKPFSADVDFTDLPISVLAENVVLLQQILMGGEMHRVLGVLKMRFSAFDQHFHEFTITEQGLTVLGRWLGPLGIVPGNTGEQPPPTAPTAGESAAGPAG